MFREGQFGAFEMVPGNMFALYFEGCTTFSSSEWQEDFDIIFKLMAA